MRLRAALLINFVVLVYFGYGQKKPNILWIMTEDIGCDMACYGTKGVHTPYMDQLAKEGALYTRAYTTASVCSPSRSSFMTGLYPHQVFSKNMRIRPPLEKKPLPEGVDIFTKYLRDAGYFIGFPGHGKKRLGIQGSQDKSLWLNWLGTDRIQTALLLPVPISRYPPGKPEAWGWKNVSLPCLGRWSELPEHFNNPLRRENFKEGKSHLILQ